ncbi:MULTISPECIES: DUF302 domain-containing protein [Morganellaceae]|nr:DUF302 domain-containing protein [Morganella morganii]
MLSVIFKWLCAISIILINTLQVSAQAKEMKNDIMIKYESQYNYAQTRENLVNAVKEHQLVLFGEFDHAKAAENVNLRMPPTTVLVFGNPSVGTPLMLNQPDLALDLPFHVLIREQSGEKVIVAYKPASSLLQGGLDEASVQKLEKLEKLVRKVIDE